MAAAEAPDSAPGDAPVGLVLVSHSAQLAEGAAELARAMAGEEVRIVAAGGMAPPETALGTDAVRVAAAIEEAWSERGVLVLMDLGSAVLSAEMAVELLPETHRKRVLLSAAPLVEGAVAAAVTARLGEPLERVASEATGSLDAKRAQVGGPAESAPAVVAAAGPDLATPAVEARIAVAIPLGLHARPAARLIRVSAGMDARVLAGNATTGSAMVSARSLNALAGLQVREGHELLVRASGPDAGKAIEALRALAARRFDEPPVTQTGPAVAPAPSAAGPSPPVPAPPTGLTGELRGIAASIGIAIGTLQFLEEADLTVPDAEATDPTAELEALELAVAATHRDLEELRDQTRTRSGTYEAAIIDADLLFLEDPELLEPTRAAIIERRLTAARAWSEVSVRLGQSWERLDDPTMRLRAADLAGVSRRVTHRLLGRPAPVLRRRGILVARDLAPTDTAALDPTRVIGIATAGGGPTSHSAILARALGIPAVVGLGDEVLSVVPGRRALLDGGRGALVLDPPAQLVRHARAQAREDQRQAARAAAAAHKPAVTRDGVVIEVAANIGAVEEASRAVAAGADGVGLLRTEFLFMEADSLPGAEAQERIYSEIATRLGGRPLTIRTLDVGADKPLPYLRSVHEDNPALGLRGIRLGLAQPEVLLAQLRAVVATARRSRVRVMFPMVSGVGEVDAARALLAQAAGSDAVSLEVGVMVEIPSAALSAARLAERVDFFSLGTNDLSQYTLAADRGNAEVAALADAFHPATLRLIAATVRAARARGRWVGVCGELAGQVEAVPLLIGLGVRELSVAVPAVARIKEAVRAADSGASVRLARRALQLADGKAVRSLISGAAGRATIAPRHGSPAPSRRASTRSSGSASRR
ncbi:MAG: phosphoenolpyruvate--protein phosphotransferase [Candidatus Dormibacteria bacterium]|jgi:phosphocarrier protein FPr